MKENINDSILGKYVIVRTRYAGVFCGYLEEKKGCEVILKDARRMWRWWAKKSISLSGCALYGIKQDKSKICSPVKALWSEAAEIIPVTDVSKESLLNCPEAEQEII